MNKALFFTISSSVSLGYPSSGVYVLQFADCVIARNGMYRPKKGLWYNSSGLQFDKHINWRHLLCQGPFYIVPFLHCNGFSSSWGEPHSVFSCEKMWLDIRWKWQHWLHANSTIPRITDITNCLEIINSLVSCIDLKVPVRLPVCTCEFHSQ